MRRRVPWVALGLGLVLLGAAAVLRRGHGGSPAPRGSMPAAVTPPAGDASRWQPGATVPDVQLLALDGQTPVRMLGRGANRPLILIVATTASPALDRCASRWRELFEIYKDRVEFLTVFTAAPDSSGAARTGRVSLDAGAANEPQAKDAVRARVDTAITFVTCNNWRIPVLVDAAGGAVAQFGTAPHTAVILDEGRRRLGVPVDATVPSDLDPVNAWLRERFTR